MSPRGRLAGGLFTASAVGLFLLITGLAITAYSLIGGGGEPHVDVKLLAKKHIVSAAYKAYGNERLGFWLAKTVVENNGDTPIYDVKISYRIPGFTEWSSHSYAAVPPGGAVVDLYYPLLPEKVAHLTSATPSKIEVRVEYRPSRGAEAKTVTRSSQIIILGVNDIVFNSLPPEENTGSFQDIFSNYPLIAAWVTPSDPVVLKYAGMAAQLAGGPATSLKDEDAQRFLAAVWDLSVANGISYQTESQAYWSGRFSEHIKFPRDVLRDKSGTCIDTAIFFAAIAMSQGLEAYIVIMPGHAFPIIRLPSGALLPIESTQLNAKASFQQAVMTGAKVAQMAFSGPHIVVDVAALHAAGIVPPELPELPPNVLEQWGYSLPGGAAGANHQQQPPPPGAAGDAQQGGNDGAGDQGQGGVVLANTRIRPYWAMQLPENARWQTRVQPLQAQGMEGGNAVAVSPEAGISIIVIWIRGASPDNMRTLTENLFQNNGFRFTVAGQNPSSTIAGEKAVLIAYQLDKGGAQAVAVARYFVHEGYGFAVIYIVFQPSQERLTYADRVVATMQWIAGV